MKILELFGEPISHGGQESFVMNAIESISKKTYMIDLCTPFYCNNEQYKKTIQKRGGKVVTFDLSFSPGNSRIKEVKPLDNFLKKNKYDIIHIHSGSVLFLALAAILSKKNKIKKIIVHSHSSGKKITWKHKLIKLFSYLPLTLCPTDYCACSIEAGKWKFPEYIVKNKLIVINNGISTERFKFDKSTRTRIRKQLGISEDCVLLGHVGRFTSEKNQSFLIQVLSQIPNKCNMQLLLIGEGPLVKDVMQLAKEKGIYEKIIQIARTDVVYDYMQAMDIFLFPSTYEGLGMVAIEAQASGLPVIASNGVPSMINITKNVVFEELDAKIWCKKINAFLNFDRVDTSKTIVDAGFDNKTTAEAIKKLYQF